MDRPLFPELGSLGDDLHDLANSMHERLKRDGFFDKEKIMERPNKAILNLNVVETDGDRTTAFVDVHDLQEMIKWMHHLEVKADLASQITLKPMQEPHTDSGWICPNCLEGMSPAMKRCDCVRFKDKPKGNTDG